MGVRLAIVRAGSQARLRNAGLLVGLVGWMAYTRFYPALHAVHATLPPCPFLFLTGHPCPLCGGTRSFASVWRGDLARASLLYPLGPALFAAVVVAIPVLALAVLARWDLALDVSGRRARAMALGAGSVLAASWALKLTVLPN